MDRFSSFRHAEATTGIGQLVEFTCPSDEVERVKEFVRANIRTIFPPTTGKVNVAHGGYGADTRYDVVQHDYAGGGPGESGGWGYIEVLEIKNPPDGRRGIVINEKTSNSGSVFTEWMTVEHARAAFKPYWCSQNTAAKFPTLAGYIRRVVCGALTPWFYAIGDERLIGDYAFPEGLQDDAAYRFGHQFVVFDDDGIPMVKTCMGTRFVKRMRDEFHREEGVYRLVYWEDGSVWNESLSRFGTPRPLQEGEQWITEAVAQFKQMLSGKSTEFAINFTDGNRFIGKLVRPKQKVPCGQGDYHITVTFKGGENPQQGWVNNFKPTLEAPDVVQFVTQRFVGSGKTVERIKVTQRKIQRGGKKWPGVFYAPSR